MLKPFLSINLIRIPPIRNPLKTKKIDTQSNTKKRFIVLNSWGSIYLLCSITTNIIAKALRISSPKILLESMFILKILFISQSFKILTNIFYYFDTFCLIQIFHDVYDFI